MARSGEGTFAHSMTDLMTSLMVIFILLLVANMNNARATAGITRAGLVKALQSALQAGSSPEDVRVRLDPSDPLGLLIIPPRQLLNFKVGQATLPPGASGFLQQFIPRLVGVVCSPSFVRAVESVAMEGHTDPRGGEDLNLGLSQQRATAVAVASLAATSAGSDRSCLEQLLTANGRGKADAVGRPNTASEWAQERQVIIKIRIRSGEEQRLMNGLGSQ